MKVRLLKEMRIRHRSGEIVDVSPEDYNFLISVNAAVPVARPKEETKAKRGAKKK